MSIAIRLCTWKIKLPKGSQVLNPDGTNALRGQGLKSLLSLSYAMPCRMRLSCPQNLTNLNLANLTYT